MVKTSTEISMGSKEDHTIAWDFEMLTEDADPENAARAGTLPMCRGVFASRGAPSLHSARGRPRRRPSHA